MESMVTPAMFDRLRAHELAKRNAPLSDEVTVEAVWLHTDLDCAFYLTRDGGVFVYEALESVARPTTRHERLVALLLGARNLSEPALLALRPERPAHATDCAKCAGSAWWSPVSGWTMVCPDCGGLGWGEPRPEDSRPTA